MTQPIKYAKHKNSRRVSLTILLVWAISAAIGSPIVLGLNNTPNREPDVCAFYNADFILYSSLSSFYIPCIIMVFLYWNIFKVSKQSQQAGKLIKNGFRFGFAFGCGFTLAHRCSGSALQSADLCTIPHQITKSDLFTRISCPRHAGSGRSVGGVTDWELPTQHSVKDCLINNRNHSFPLSFLGSYSPHSLSLSFSLSTLSLFTLLSHRRCAVVLGNNGLPASRICRSWRAVASSRTLHKHAAWRRRHLTAAGTPAASCPTSRQPTRQADPTRRRTRMPSRPISMIAMSSWTISRPSSCWPRSSRRPASK